MAAQHLPRDLVRPSSGLKELAQKKTTKKMPHVTVIITKNVLRCINSQVYYDSLHSRLSPNFQRRVLLFKQALP